MIARVSVSPPDELGATPYPAQEISKAMALGLSLPFFPLSREVATGILFLSFITKLPTCYLTHSTLGKRTLSQAKAHSTQGVDCWKAFY